MLYMALPSDLLHYNKCSQMMQSSQGVLRSQPPTTPRLTSACLAAEPKAA